jgi:hypothetical protein
VNATAQRKVSKSRVKSSILERMSVIIPMVLQIGETMVLQGVELEEKRSTPHF